MSLKLNLGVYLFSTVKDIRKIDRQDAICKFKEEEGITVIIDKCKADELKLNYKYVVFA